MTGDRAKRALRNPSTWLGLVLLLAIAAYAAVRSRGPGVPTVVVARHDLEQHIVASGRVMPPARSNVASLVAGLVVTVGAVEGQHVKKGDLLVQLDDAEARAQVAQAKANAAQASAKVEQLKRVGAIVASQGLRESESRLQSAQTDLARDEKLAEQGAIPTADLDRSRRAVDIALAQQRAASAQQVGTVGADSRVALSAALFAQAQLTSAELRLAQSRVLAAADGVVLSRSVEIGDVIQPARTLLVVASDGDVELVFQADERNLPFLALGQSARASADAFPQTVFPAEVNYLAPSIDPQRGTVEVHLRVPAPPAFLRPDMTISVDLRVAERKAVLTVPAEAIRGLATETPWVLAVEGGRALRKNVTLGIRGEGEIELLSGVGEGQIAVVPDGRILALGTKVRVVPKAGER